MIIPGTTIDLPNEAVAGIAVGVLFFGLFIVFRIIGGLSERARVNALRKQADEQGKLFLPDKDELEPSTLDDWFVRLVARSGTGLTPLAGMAVCIFFAIGLSTITFLWLENIYIAGAGFLVGMLTPIVVFGLLGWNRRRKIQNQLPDALFLMSRAVRAGLTLDQAIELGSQQTIPPLSGELAAITSQIRLGLTTKDALSSAAKRIQLVDFDSLVSTAAVYQTTGGNLPLIMDRLALSARDRNNFRGYFLAATAQGRITAIFIGLAAPALLVASYFTQPEMIEGFFRNPNAPLVTAIAIGLEILGIFWLYRILKVDY